MKSCATMKVPLAVVGAFFLLCACGPSDEAAKEGREASAVTSGRVEEGRRVSKEQCAICHAIKGEHTITPSTGAPSFTLIADNPTYTDLALRVFFQSHHERMPSFVLSDQEQEDVIAYILSLRPPQTEAN